jgi:hypothetical protein
MPHVVFFIDLPIDGYHVTLSVRLNSETAKKNEGNRARLYLVVKTAEGALHCLFGYRVSSSAKARAFPMGCVNFGSALE